MIYAFLTESMCFMRKGMCSSNMNNVPNATTFHYLAGISKALHIHSLMAMGTAFTQKCTSDPVTHRC